MVVVLNWNKQMGTFVAAKYIIPLVFSMARTFTHVCFYATYTTNIWKLFGPLAYQHTYKQTSHQHTNRHKHPLTCQDTAQHKQPLA